MVAVAAGLLLAWGRWAPSDPLEVRGPLVTLAILGCYLAAWGVRRVLLLRTVLLLSVLAWPPVASAVHQFVRATLELPSTTIYQQLARLEFFGVAEEPWRLFTASLNRGSLVIVTTVVLAMSVYRWRLTAGMLVKLLACNVGGLVAHHAIVLVSAVDEYSPTDSVQLATNPVLEIAIGAIAIGLVAVLQNESSHALVSPHQRDSADRDPVIFAASRGSGTLVGEVLLLTPLLPLLEVLVHG